MSRNIWETRDPMIEAFKRLKNIHRALDLAKETLEEQIKTPICLPNCGRCCEHNTPIMTTIEAMYAISLLTGRGKIGIATDITQSWLIERNPAVSTYNGMPHGQPSDQIMAEWRAVRQSRCPFLDANKGCFIHEARPLVCRTYGVTRDPSSVYVGDYGCPRPLGVGETSTSYAYISGEGIRSLVKNLHAYCQQENQSWVISGHAPTLIYRAAKEDDFRLKIHNNLIPSAKIIGIDYEVSIMWQSQVDALRSGVDPNLVMAHSNL